MTNKGKGETANNESKHKKKTAWVKGLVNHKRMVFTSNQQRLKAGYLRNGKEGALQQTMDVRWEGSAIGMRKKTFGVRLGFKYHLLYYELIGSEKVT